MFSIRRWTSPAWVAGIGLLGTLVLGTWWVWAAMLDGEAVSAIRRLSLVGLCGAYYVLLLQAVTVTNRFRR